MVFIWYNKNPTSSLRLVGSPGFMNFILLRSVNHRVSWTVLIFLNRGLLLFQ